MKYSEFQRWLISQGVSIDKTHGKGSHRTANLNGKSTTFPYHGSKENRRRIKAKDT